MDDRHQKAGGSIHCDADVVLTSHDQSWFRWIGGGVDAGVEYGVGVEGERERFYDEREEREFGGAGVRGSLSGRAGFVQAVAERGEGCEVDFVCVEEVGDAEGGGHGFEHLGLDVC